MTSPTSQQQAFCAAHYTCLGGHLSTLRLVLKVKTRRECAKSQCSVHLSFASHNLLASADIQDVVDLLMAHGANTDDPSDRVESSAYDIILKGLPLDWAVITRNSTLVHALLP